MPPPLGAGGSMFSGCASVRPSEARNTLFPSVHGSVGSSDQPWPFYGMSVRPSVSPSVRPSVRPSREVSGYLPENARREFSKILHADVSWPPSKLIRLWPRFVDFPPFGATLTYWNGSNLGFLSISQRTYAGNGMKIDKLMHPDHLKKWLLYGQGLLIFLILAQFWLSETGPIWGFRTFLGERIKGMAWTFVCWCILTIFKTN